MRNILILVIISVLIYLGYKYFDDRNKGKDKDKDKGTNQNTGLQNIGSKIDPNDIFYYRSDNCTLFIDADVSQINNLKSIISGYGGTNYSSKYLSNLTGSWRHVFDFRPKKSSAFCLCKCNTTKQVEKLIKLGAKENHEII